MSMAPTHRTRWSARVPCGTAASWGSPDSEGSILHDGLLVMREPRTGSSFTGCTVPLPLGLAPEARQALIRERIAKIFE